MPNPQVYIDIVGGIEGPSVYINDIRVAGPKPWAGGALLHHFLVDVKDIEDALKGSNRSVATCIVCSEPLDAGACKNRRCRAFVQD